LSSKASKLVTRLLTFRQSNTCI